MLAALLAVLLAAGAPGAEEAALARLEAAVLDAVNEVRQAHGRPPLRPSAALAALARAHSRRMSQGGFFDHRDPAAGSVGDRARAAGVAFRTIGENISETDAPDPVERVVAGWLQSAGHRANILDPRFGETGVGVWRAGATYYVTQVFLGADGRAHFGGSRTTPPIPPLGSRGEAAARSGTPRPRAGSQPLWRSQRVGNVF